jgi:CRP/FNR family transcriptional regulator, cyclic AMP receptor protein
MDVVQVLKNTLLFKDVPESILAIVAECVEERTITGGAPIVSSHQTTGSLYIIRRGSVQGTRGGEATPIVLGPGQSFGHVSLLDGGPVGMSVQALDPTELLVIDAAKLRKKLSGNFEAGCLFYRAVATSLATRLRRAVDAYILATEGSGASQQAR